MKVIQSFWSCHKTNLLGFKAGWISPEYNVMSWALSCLQLKKYYNHVALYADTASAKLLIDTIALPYSEVTCKFDDLNKYDPGLWALPKIISYNQQEKPFIHVDGDVFIWKEFDKKFLSGKLIAQNLEVSTEYYEKIMQSLELELAYFPPEILAERKSASKIYAYNAGIIGGHDVDFFKAYAKKALNFITKNKSRLTNINVSNFNIFFEQYLFYCLVRKGNREVSVLIGEVIGDNKYKGFGDFVDVPHSKHYLHLLGDYKRIESVCLQMANRLRQDYPEYYYRIIALFKSKKIPLLKDYYWFERDNTEIGLLLRHNFLKDAYVNDQVLVEGEVNVSKTILRESVCWRTTRLEIILKSIDTKDYPSIDRDRQQKYLADLSQFEDALWDVVYIKFKKVSNTYLLARDICYIGYSEYIFRDNKYIYEKMIVADDLSEKIESQFDWSTTTAENISINLAKMDEMTSSEIFTLVIPECDLQGYSLFNIDELDWLILHTIKKGKTIRELFDQIKFAFDADDLESSKVEFEKLIFSRIKKGLLNKSIKAVIPPKGDI